MMKNDARERFTLRIPTVLYHQLLTRAEEIGVSLNALILQILWTGLEGRKTHE